MEEEKYLPEMSKMNLEVQQGLDSAIKKLAERRLTSFESDIKKVIGRGRYDKEDFKNVKDFKTQNKSETIMKISSHI